MDQIVDPDVRAFFERFIGARTAALRADERLLDDLGLDGDDAVEFFAEFEEWFGGDLRSLYAMTRGAKIALRTPRTGASVSLDPRDKPEDDENDVAY